MAGRIKDDDIALVREKSRIDEVVSAHVTLRNAGGGSLKGLCPFHDEKSPSFHVTPARGFYHCFGCQEGGDVITFVQKIEGVGFSEAVERLAGRYGVDLRYDDDGGSAPRRDPGQRSRLLEAHRAAAEFYAEQLSTPDAVAGRRFLTDRGFDRDAAERFGVGFAPRTGDALTRHLRGRGFRGEELAIGGLTSRSGYDRFRGRLVWPIREVSGDVVGFGARRLYDDDRIDAKYLNTPETPLYKKSHQLYGVDLARKEIARTSQAVVVEGYTDVMACHLAGVSTAVATCGTAFGDDHTRILRRLLLDHDEFRGEVIFTFDGDEAGQRAALKAFQGDSQFVGQTYVAVEPDGRDPCDLRLAEGDAAVRELVARRVPLYRFVLGNVVNRFDLDRADARVDAMREAAKLVTSVRDRSKVGALVRELSKMLGGYDEAQILDEVRRAAARGHTASSARPPTAQGSATGPPDGAPTGPPDGAATSASEPPAGRSADVPDPQERRFSIERDVLKLALQHPAAISTKWDELDADDFVHPYYRSIFEAVVSLAGPRQASAELLTEKVVDPAVARVVSALAVEPLHVNGVPDARVASEYVVRLRELTALRRIAQVKSKLQRMNPVNETAEYNRLFGELVALESHRRSLREQAIGTGL